MWKKLPFIDHRWSTSRYPEGRGVVSNIHLHGKSWTFYPRLHIAENTGKRFFQISQCIFGLIFIRSIATLDRNENQCSFNHLTATDSCTHIENIWRLSTNSLSNISHPLGWSWSWWVRISHVRSITRRIVEWILSDVCSWRFILCIWGTSRNIRQFSASRVWIICAWHWVRRELMIRRRSIVRSWQFMNWLIDTRNTSI